MPPVDDEKIMAYIERCSEIIAGRGWMVQGVGSDGKQPGWCYTVGFGPTLDHPEYMIFGLSFEVATIILNSMGDRIQRGEAEWLPGGRYTDVFTGRDEEELTAAIIVVERRHYPEYFGLGRRMYREKGWGQPTWHQIVWPDKEGYLPWEPGFNSAMRRAQPILGKWRS